MVSPTNNFILSQEGYAELPYLARALYRVNEWRDRQADGCLSLLAARVVCLVVYPLIHIASVYQSIWWRIQSSYNHNFYFEFRSAYCSWTKESAVFCFKKNLFAKKIIPLSFEDNSTLWLKTIQENRIKTLSHWLNISETIPINGENIDLSAAGHGRMWSSVSNSLSTFFKCLGCSALSLSRNQAKELEDAVLLASKKEEALKTRIKNIRSGKLCLQQTGWKGHSICLAFCGDYLAIGNSGPCPDNASPLQVYKINRSLMNESILNKILDPITPKEKEAFQYFYETLPGQLSGQKKPVQDEFCRRFGHYKRNDSSGPCVLYSILSLLPFAWAMLIDKKPSSATIDRAFLESEFFSSWAAVRYATHYKDGEEFQSSEFSKLIAKNRKEKEHQVTYFGTILHSPFLKRCPKARFLFSEKFMGTMACTTLYACAAIGGSYFPKLIAPCNLLGLSFQMAVMADFVRSDRIVRLFTSHAWKGFEDLSCREEILKA